MYSHCQKSVSLFFLLWGGGRVNPSPAACPTMNRSLSNTAHHPETHLLLLTQILLYDPNPNARIQPVAQSVEPPTGWAPQGAHGAKSQTTRREVTSWQVCVTSVGLGSEELTSLQPAWGPG